MISGQHVTLFSLFFCSETTQIFFAGISARSDSALIFWSWPPDLEANITGFTVQFRESGSEVWTNSTETDPDERSITLTDLMPGTQYEVRVLAVSKYREEVYSGSLPQPVRTLRGKLLVC